MAMQQFSTFADVVNVVAITSTEWNWLESLAKTALTLMPQHHWFPNSVWCNTGSRIRPLFFVELAAANKVDAIHDRSLVHRDAACT